MSLRDRLLAVLVAVLWGVNFPAIHLALNHFPPLMCVAVRFALIAVPTLLFVPRPDVAWRWLLGYGVGFGVLQFVFLYLAMDQGMPTGLASLVLQSSAPFTVLLGMLLLRERPGRRMLVGIAVAAIGLGGIGIHRAFAHGGAGAWPVLLTLLGGLGWALGNLANRRAATRQPVRLMLWMTTIPPLPMLAASLLVEGPRRDLDAVTGLFGRTGLIACGGLAYTVLLGTLLGSGLWTWLLSRYPSSQVAPHSMLVPVAGIGASWLLLGESTPWVELAFGTLVVAGVLGGGGVGTKWSSGRANVFHVKAGTRRQQVRVAE